MPDEESAQGGLGFRVCRLLTPVWHAWLWARERLLVLRPCRIAVLMVIAGLAFLIVASQGQDVVRALAEQRTGHRDEWQQFFFFAASLVWSMSAWYWARVMLFLRLPGVPSQDGRLRPFREWTPRLLGFAATLGVALALYLAATGYTGDEHGDVRGLLRLYAFWCLVGAVAFLIAVSVRRPLSRYAHRKLKGAPSLQNRMARPVVAMLNVPHRDELVYGALELKDLGPLTRGLLGIALLTAVSFFLVFVAAVQPVAPMVGSAAILLLAAAGWIAVGSVLDFIGMRLHFPVFFTLFVVAIVFSAWNDNHAVRTLPEPQSTSAGRGDLPSALDAWMTLHQAELARGGQNVPMYLVDAEGGGIRAAYWTVTVLGEIQNRNPCFADHLFSLSGVSGGSLGVSVFDALLVEARSRGAVPRCGPNAPPVERPFDIKARGQGILSEDFLSPVVASMLYPDLMQRFLFWPIDRFDRALALEKAWERAWDLHVRGQRNRLGEPLDRLWEDRTHWTPALFLNATWVETGKRIIASNVEIAGTKATEYFVDTEDARRFFAPRSIALSTAAHLSARFTYVSPAGSLVKDGRVYGRVVDGGYFENSGATTTLEILKTIDVLADQDERWQRVEPYVIHISNEPVDPSLGPSTLETAPGNAAIAPRRILNEVLSPLWSMLDTRDARGVYARETVQWHVGLEHFLHFGLCRRSGNVPLGWVLSESTRGRMEDQLVRERCRSDSPGSEPIFDNPAKLDDIVNRLVAAGG